MGDVSDKTPWTDAEDSLLWSLKSKGYQNQQIADAMNRPYRAVCGRLVRAQTHSFRSETRKTAVEQSCLTCSKPFKSEGPHHRRCDRCRKKG